MKRFLHFLVLCLLWTSHATAQAAVVKRNVNLRSDASSDSDIVKLLKPGAQLLLVEPDQINRFYHVTTDDGKDGWVWARNIKVLAGTAIPTRSEEHTSELQSRLHLVCRLLLEKKNTIA